MARRGVREKIPAATYSPTRKPCSTIGSGGLNCRVRDGNGWNPSDVATGKRGRLHRVPASSVGRLATDVATGKRGRLHRVPASSVGRLATDVATGKRGRLHRAPASSAGRL